jgi:hypothetical protein
VDCHKPDPSSRFLGYSDDWLLANDLGPVTAHMAAREWQTFALPVRITEQGFAAPTVTVPPPPTSTVPGDYAICILMELGTQAFQA